VDADKVDASSTDASSTGGTTLTQPLSEATLNAPTSSTTSSTTTSTTTSTTPSTASSMTNSDSEMEQVPLAPFVYRGSIGTLGQRFEDWLELFDLYLVANKTSEEKKKAIFLLKVGEELLTVYRSKRKADKSDTYEEIRKMLEAHVKPITVVFTEVMVFRRAARHEGETANEFAIRLRQLAKNCQFKELEAEILQQFVAGIGRHDVERKCVTAENLTLEKAVEIATTLENLDANLKGLHAPTEKELRKHGVGHIGQQESEETVNAFKQAQSNTQRNYTGANRGGANRYNQTGDGDRRPRQDGGQLCGYCGRSKHQSRDQCPARGKECKKCGKPNHFATVCRSEPSSKGAAAATSNSGPDAVRKVTFSDSRGGQKLNQIGAQPPMVQVSEEAYNEYLRYCKSVEWMGAIKKSSVNRLNDGPRRRFSLLGLNIECLVDTGAPVNIIDEATFNKLSPRPTLSKCKTTYFPYGEGCSPIPIVGQFTTRIQYGSKECLAGFVVVGPNEECLMSFHTATALGIVKMDGHEGIHSINKPSVDQSNALTATKGTENNRSTYPPPKRNGKYSKEEFKEMFPKLFSGVLGCVKDVRVHLDLDPDVKPVRQKLRPLPFHLRDAVSKEIKKAVGPGNSRKSHRRHGTNAMGLEHRPRPKRQGGPIGTRWQADHGETAK
jgi:hypothetical protein